VKIGPDSVKLKNFQLEAIAGERLMKIQQAGKGLACAAVICELWRLAVAL
jgi:hypothetical protein